jgi:hypothetical protein
MLDARGGTIFKSYIFRLNVISLLSNLDYYIILFYLNIKMRHFFFDE